MRRSCACIDDQCVCLERRGFLLMNTDMKLLKREEILTLAQEAKLMLVDGDACYLNDMATDKELISLVRLIESALKQHN
ncbi:MAG: hypothetical protein V7606_614 [Burkholderiales bacterium]|jgi:hypothetical protein|nr:hypothetical protein [Burkholderia sp.]